MRRLRLITEPDYDIMSKTAAELFAERLRGKPDGVFGFATGGTPLGMYREFIESRERLDFSGITTFNLDEYHPMPRGSTHSYYHFMRRYLFDHVNVNMERVFFPDGMAADIEAECRDYEAKIEYAGGLDLQILGIGHNGHIGFNEPDEAFTAGTHYTALTERTVASNARFFPSHADAPRHAITVGMRVIMGAREILLLCGGESKAEILRDALRGPVTPLVPASILQLHPRVTVVADKDAASLICRA